MSSVDSTSPENKFLQRTKEHTNKADAEHNAAEQQKNTNRCTSAHHHHNPDATQIVSCPSHPIVQN